MNVNDDFVILVDEHDQVTGIAPKLLAHQYGRRHRAISVCVVNSEQPHAFAAPGA